MNQLTVRGFDPALARRIREVAKARGLSLKEIADHLGHRSLTSTRIYAKVDIQGLREVAAFDLGGLA
jgi:site-specific recombinase XerC